jgi:hypothetical protein
VSVTPAGVALAGGEVFSGGTRSEASAFGISSDGRGSDHETTVDIAASSEGAEAGFLDVLQQASGQDTIVNEEKVGASATAVSPAISVAVAPAGVAGAINTSTARANASAIDAGGEADSITNTGELEAIAVANADTLNVTVAVIGVGASGNSVWDGGTTAEAEARGISADGMGVRKETEGRITLDTSEGVEDATLGIFARTLTETASADDVVDNAGDIDAKAVAVSVTATAGVAAVGGVGAAVSTSTATADAAAIETGGGDDEIDNSGELLADADAVAVTVNGSWGLIGAGVSADAVWNGGTTARATAIGIDAEGRGQRVETVHEVTASLDGLDTSSTTTVEEATGDDHVLNSEKVEAFATAVSNTNAVGLGGIAGVAISTATAEAQATAIGTGAGADEVENSGALFADAAATAVPVNVSVSAGLALSVNDVWDGGAKADAVAYGIDSGDGDDLVTNEALIDAKSESSAPSISVAFSAILAGAISTSTSEAEAAAIHGGAGEDEIRTSGRLETEAKAGAAAVQVAASSGVALAVDKVWDGGTTADTRAAGVDGGAGGDEIENDGFVMSTAESDATSVGVSLVAPVAGAISTSTAKSHATALTGEEGADVIENRGEFDVLSDAEATAVSVSVNPAGIALAADAFWDGGTKAQGTARGIEGGAGNDTLTNAGPMLVVGNAKTHSVAVGATLTGVVQASAASTATADATAIDGGDDDDEIENGGDVSVDAISKATGVNVEATLVGATLSLGESNTRAEALAHGITGGAGSDGIGNTATVDVLASATANSTDVSVNLVGYADAGASTEAVSVATGIAGGDGIDEILNEGVVIVGSVATGDRSNVAVDLLGASSAQASSTAGATATGIAGGGDDDRIEDLGVMGLVAQADVKASAVGVNLVGATNVDTATASTASATGLSGGEGLDEIVHRGAMEILADADQLATGGTFSLIGSASSTTGLVAESQAVGIAGCADADGIVAAGAVDLTADSDAELDGTGDAVTIIGGAAGTGAASATASVTGIAGGDGHDVVEHLGTLTGLADALSKTSGSNSFTLAGAAAGDESLGATATAAGITTGEGDDDVVSVGAIVMDAKATVDLGDATIDTVFGVSGNESAGAAGASGVGIDAGDGTNSVTNASQLTMRSFAEAKVDGGSFTFGGAASSESFLSAGAEAAGITGGSGDDVLANWLEGDVFVRSEATASVQGAGTVIFGSPQAGGRAGAESFASGFDAGRGANSVVNSGRLIVESETTIDIDVKADAGVGNSLATGEALGIVSHASGVVSGDGADVIENRESGDFDGFISVLAESEVDVYAEANTVLEASVATATGSASTVAVGIGAGQGVNTITNAGRLEVTSDADVTASTRATSKLEFEFFEDGEIFDIELGESDAISTATATASAVGIESGNDGSEVMNSGALVVSASADAVAQADALGLFPPKICGPPPFDGICIPLPQGDLNPVSTTTATADAVGIRTGAGDDRIVNTGTIEVTASRTGTSGTATAAGISSGAGDDVVINEGSIVTSAPGGSRIGITTAEGSDTVVLGTDSSVSGGIDLGEDDDTLELIGTPVVVGSVQAGSGADALLLRGAGSFSSPLLSFAAATKQGGGTFTLPTLATVQRLEVDEGTLRLNDSYAMADSGSFHARVNGDGSHGQLDVGGTATLDGTLEVVNGGGLYADGTIFDVVTAGTLAGSFDAEVLPAPTPLLSFSVDTTPSAVNVISSVASLVTVAEGPAELALARYLEAQAPTAGADVARTLGALQRLSAGPLRSTFAALSPERMDGSAATFASVRRYVAGTQARMADVRSRTVLGSSFLSAAPSAFVGTPAGFASAKHSGAQKSGRGAAQLGGFLAGVAGNGGRGAVGTPNGALAGFDFVSSGRLVAGLATGLGLDDSGDLGGGRSLSSHLTSVYATYVPVRNVYVESVLAFGVTRHRHLSAPGSVGTQAYGERRGRVWSAFGEVGRAFSLGGLESEVFGSLLYSSSKEEAFSELSAGPMAFAVDGRRFQTLTTEFGLRAGRAFETAYGTWRPLLSVAWVHDHAVGDRSISARLENLPDTSFRFEPEGLAPDGVRLGAGLDFVGGETWLLEAGADADLRRGHHAVSGLLQLRVRF